MRKRENNDSEAIGARLYESMSNVQKEQLNEYLSKELDSRRTHGSFEWDTIPQAAAAPVKRTFHDEGTWRELVSRRVASVVHRRASSGESLDAHEVIEEVLPFSRSVIPSEVRKGLFRRIAEMIDLGDPED